MLGVAVLVVMLTLVWLLPPTVVVAVIFGVCGVLSLARRRDGRESVVRLESPRVSRAPQSVERSTKRR